MLVYLPGLGPPTSASETAHAKVDGSAPASYTFDCHENVSYVRFLWIDRRA